MADNAAQQSDPQAGTQTDPGYRSQAVDAARAGMTRAAHSAADRGQEAARHYLREPAADIVSLLRDYAREKPDVAAIWCFGIGLIVGWKLKP